MVEGLPGGIDPRLWVVVTGVDGRCYLSGNAHTFRGRIQAWSQDLERSLTVSKHEISDSSVEARYWVEGFLAGNEPEGSLMFGPSFWEGEEDLTERWLTALEDFRASGAWKYGDWDLPLPFPSELDLPATPWLLRADEIWVWPSHAWVRMDPQPTDPPCYLPPGAPCGREGHDMTALTDCHLVCLKCGRTDATSPDDVSFEDWAFVKFTYRPRFEEGP